MKYLKNIKVLLNYALKLFKNLLILLLIWIFYKL